MKNRLAALRRILTCTCEQASRLASDGLDRPLSRTEKWALRSHLLVCRGCRRVARQLTALRAAIAAMSDQTRARLSTHAVHLTPGRKQSIAAAMRNELRSSD